MRLFLLLFLFFSLIACDNRKLSTESLLSSMDEVIKYYETADSSTVINDSISQLDVPLSFKDFILGDSYSKCLKNAEKNNNFHMRWDRNSERYVCVTELLGVDVFVTVEEYRDTIYEIQLNSSSWSEYRLDSLYKSHYGITGYDDILASESKAGWGEQKDTKWIYNNGIVEINHIYSDGNFKGAYVVYTDKQYSEKKKNDSLKPQYIKDSMTVANEEKTQINRLKLYKPSSSSYYDELESNLKNNHFHNNYSYRAIGNSDTIAYFDDDNESRVTIEFSPNTKLVSSFSYRWEYQPTVIDEYSSENPKYNKGYSDYYLIKSGVYFMNVFEILSDDYGTPTTVMIDKQPGLTTSKKYITDKKRIDALNLTGLIDRPCHFEVFWENSERKVVLTYFNGGGYASTSAIEYEYINKNNVIIRQDEIEAVNRKNLYAAIGRWSLCIILAIIMICFTISYVRRNKNNNDKKLCIKRTEEEWAIWRKKRNEAKKQEELEHKRQVTEHAAYLSSLTKQYGSCDKFIKLPSDSDNLYNELLVFSESKHISINQKTFSFSDILDCTVNDDFKERDTVETYRDPSIATTSTNSGNMLKRAAIGGFLFGNVGAIIGGSTAQKDSTIEYGNEKTIHNKEINHNYTIVVTVRDIKNPNLLINVGNDTKLKDEIASLFRVVISMK